MSKLFFLLLIILSAAAASGGAAARKPHVIDFRSPDLHPSSFTWDPNSDHFIVSSLLHPSLISVSDAAVVSPLSLSSPSLSLPSNSSFLSLSLHPRHHLRRLLAAVHLSDPPFSSLATFEIPSFRLLSLTPLAVPEDFANSPTIPAAVAVDYAGNAYVTDSDNDVIFKVTESGEASILSRSSAFNFKRTENRTEPYRTRGLNGVVYNSKGYLLVVQSNTGRLFKVNADDGTARRVILNRDLIGAEGIAMRRDGVVLVVSSSKLYFVKSDDSWSEGVVFDETALDEERRAVAVAVGAEDRVYVLYGEMGEGGVGNKAEGEVFGIAEIVSEKENAEENVWIFVLIGLGLAYFLFWRFQMRQLVQNMNKKSA